MIKGMVTETHGERAKVRVNFKETTERGLRAYIDCWNPISAHERQNGSRSCFPSYAWQPGGSSAMPWPAFSSWISGSGLLWGAA